MLSKDSVHGLEKQTIFSLSLEKKTQFHLFMLKLLSWPPPYTLQQCHQTSLIASLRPHFIFTQPHVREIVDGHVLYHQTIKINKAIKIIKTSCSL